MIISLVLKFSLVNFFIVKLASLWIFSTFSFGKLLEKFNLEKPGKGALLAEPCNDKNLDIDENDKKNDLKKNLEWDPSGRVGTF